MITVNRTAFQCDTFDRDLEAGARSVASVGSSTLPRSRHRAEHIWWQVSGKNAPTLVNIDSMSLQCLREIRLLLHGSCMQFPTSRGHVLACNYAMEGC